MQRGAVIFTSLGHLFIESLHTDSREEPVVTGFQVYMCEHLMVHITIQLLS